MKKFKQFLNLIKESVNINDNFDKWFNKSCVIENNQPVICYHGTDENFNIFSKNKIGTNHWQSKTEFLGGFFFADKKQFCFRSSKFVMEVYLKIQNPLIRTAGDYHYAVDMYDRNSQEFLKLANENGNDGIIIKSPNGSLYVVFEPIQIKSVKNNGNWSVKNENIFL